MSSKKLRKPYCLDLANRSNLVFLSGSGSKNKKIGEGSEAFPNVNCFYHKSHNGK